MQITRNTLQIPITLPEQLSHCSESILLNEKGQVPGSDFILEDTALAHAVDQALWKNEVLRAMDYYEIDVLVHNKIVILSGHIVGSSSNDRVEKAIGVIPGVLAVKNNLVLDDKLTTEVASSLGELEHTYNCKFFTGVSHGVVALHGNVSDENVKSLAEKCVASHPNVRGVINCLSVQGSVSKLQDTPIYQPSIGKEILFLNGVSGIVRQVIINPDNRLVTAMTLAGRFTDPRQESRTMSNNEARPPERLILVSVDFVRNLSKTSGFLTISSLERNHYSDFDPSEFRTPNADWVPPYPYCPRDVLFPMEKGSLDQPVGSVSIQPLLAVKSNETVSEQILANDSLGG